MVGSCGATITYPHPSSTSSHASLCVRVTPPTCPPDPAPPCSGRHPQQPNDRLDRPPCQPVCLLHYWDMDCVSITHSHTYEYTHTHIHTPQWCLTFPVQQVRHGCDEPPCLSSGELVSLSFSLPLRHTHRHTLSVVLLQVLQRVVFRRATAARIPQELLHGAGHPPNQVRTRPGHPPTLTHTHVR